jgi:signal transduction histidine kinase/ActR/RegA family two-component response regulator
MESPSRTPPARSTAEPVTLTLIERRATFWLFAAGSAAFCAAWISESWLNVLAASDRVAYPLMAILLLVLALLVRRSARHLVRAQRIASLAVALYLVGSMLLVMLRTDQPLNLYGLGSATPWMVGMQLMLFATWPLRRALGLSLSLTAVLLTGALMVDARTSRPPDWQTVLWPLIVNGCIAQLFFAGALYGVSRQLRRLAALAAPSDGRRVHTVDALVARQLSELERARDAAQQASHAKSRFLAVMSHELRTPLHGVIGAAELLRDGRRDAANHGELIGAIEGGAAHLLSLINHVLDLSRIEAGRFELARETFDVRECIAQALQAVAPQAAAQGLRLEHQIAAGVPAWSEGDAVRLRQALINLLGNAVKFTEAGHVRLDAQPDADSLVLFTISDTGIGIPEDEQALVFDAFHQADASSTRRYAGSGLGLTITRELAALMGGSLRLHSRPGQGTVVELRMPLPAVAAPAQAWAESDAAPLTGALGHASLLLVDDDPVNMLVAGEMLISAGVHVELAANGEEALQRLRERPVDVVLMDWRMPGMDGLEATRRVRDGEAGERARALPIIGFTANAYAEDRAACLAAGMNEVLVKPVDRRTLLRAVALCLQTR